MNIDKNEIMQLFKSLHDMDKPLFITGPKFYIKSIGKGENKVQKKVFFYDKNGNIEQCEQFNEEFVREKQGDFNKLIQMFYQFASYFANNYTINQKYIEEFKQEAIIDALKGIKKYNINKSNPFSYFYSLFSRAFLYYLRKEKDKSDRKPNICSLDLLNENIQDCIETNIFNNNVNYNLDVILSDTYNEIQLINQEFDINSLKQFSKLKGKDLDLLEKELKMNIINLKERLKSLDKIKFNSIHPNCSNWISNLHVESPKYNSNLIKEYISKKNDDYKRIINLLRKKNLEDILVVNLQEKKDLLKKEITFLKTYSKSTYETKPCFCHKIIKDQIEYYKKELNKINKIKTRNCLLKKVRKEQGKNEKIISYGKMCFEREELMEITRNCKILYKQHDFIIVKDKFFSKKFDSYYTPENEKIGFLLKKIVEYKEKKNEN